MLLVQCEVCAAKYADCCSPSCREIHLLPEDVQRAWRKGRSTRSTKTKAINDPVALRARIAEEEALLAAGRELRASSFELRASSHELIAASTDDAKLEARGSQLEAYHTKGEARTNN
jgi:hypothetical protein